MVSSPGGQARQPGGASGELAGVVQVPRLLWRFPSLLVRPRAPGRVVIVMPGRNTGDLSTAPLRAYLRLLGHRPLGWSLGQNHGRIDEILPEARRVVRRVAAETGGPVALVGQSMGGYVAREVARADPDVVDRVVTLGTPIFARRRAEPIRCPVTAIYSRADRVVSTARSIDRDPTTRNVEVQSTHFAMGIDPDVWRIVADELARPDPAR